MTYSERARTTYRRSRARRVRAGLMVVVAAIVAALGYGLVASSPSTVTSSIDVLRGDRGERRVPLGPADGAVPKDTTVFAGELPAVANLDPALLDALRRAATDAAQDGVELFVDSGWRSAAYQRRLFRRAVSEHGSREEAARWVATAKTSAHVSGDAVDIGHSDATTWLSEHGAAYGLCQVYDNEPWHYELRPEAVGRGCPPMYADPTEDPRMWRASG